MTDHAAFVGIYALIRQAAEFGAPYSEPEAVAG